MSLSEEGERREAFFLIPDTQELPKVQQLWRETTLHAQRYPDDLKSYIHSYMLNLSYVIMYVFRWIHKVVSQHVVVWVDGNCKCGSV